MEKGDNGVRPHGEDKSMRRKHWLFILLGVLAACMMVRGRGGVPTPNPALSALPHRDLIYQTSLREVSMPGIESTQTNTVSMVDIDGSGKVAVALQEHKAYLHAPRIDPKLDMVLYLASERPDSSVEGWLEAYKEGIPQHCSAYLAQRPSRVGRGALYVGVHYWRSEGGIVLFDFTQDPCRQRELFTREEMERLKVRQATGFHTQEKMLLVGRHFYVYDLSTEALQEIQLPDAEMCRLSPSDRFVACLSQKGSYKGVWLRVFQMADGRLQHERFITPEYEPGFGLDVSWSPSEDALVYHHCVYPDDNRSYYSCGLQGGNNLGLYRWNLETNEEKLVTTGGILPFWIDWGSAPSRTPPSP
jgi:hypothetical protein